MWVGWEVEGVGVGMKEEDPEQVGQARTVPTSRPACEHGAGAWPG